MSFGHFLSILIATSIIKIRSGDKFAMISNLTVLLLFFFQNQRTVESQRKTHTIVQSPFSFLTDKILLCNGCTKCLFNLDPEKSSFCRIRNVENCPLLKVKQKFEKKAIVLLVVKSRNYREGITYVVKVYYKVYIKIFETAYFPKLLQIFLQKCCEKSYRFNISKIVCLGYLFVYLDGIFYIFLLNSSFHFVAS